MKTLINAAQITKVYTGAPGCACGCRGNYSTAKNVISKVLKIYNKTEVEAVQEGSMPSLDGENFVFWDNAEGTRTYTIYFKEVV
jgi:hypothetical protein